ncbi:MAG: helix-turn-helix domain-containing protein [Defluviitaleaceae bacterium]|nr:helix-turn-helix domain-containing protein [Defluviitaleaceae bacterium]
MLHIAENLKTLRKGKDLTQEEAAEILGVSPQSVSKWERGTAYPDIALLPALAKEFAKHRNSEGTHPCRVLAWSSFLLRRSGERDSGGNKKNN